MAQLLRIRPNKLLFPGTLPALNRAHPAANGCILAIVPNGFNFFNLVNSAQGTVNNLGSGLSYKIFPNFGPTILYTSGTNDVITFSGAYNGSGGLTIAGITAIQGNPGTTSYLLNDSATGTNGVGTQISGSGNVLDGIIAGSGTSLNAIPLSYTNVPYFIAVSYGSSIANVVLRRLDTGAIQFQNGFSTGLTPSVGDGTLYIGSRGAARMWDGEIAAISYSNTFLSTAQLLQWADDPWSLWYPNGFDTGQALHGTFGGGATAGLRFNSSLNGLGASGPFFHDRIAS